MILQGPRGWTIELDARQIFPDDPGMGTPALIVAPSGLTATFWCGLDTGEVDCGTEVIPPDVLKWLNSQVNTVEDWLDEEYNKLASPEPYEQASREEQAATYLDCGSAAWDDVGDTDWDSVLEDL
jgi:hypothetical protein